MQFDTIDASFGNSVIVRGEHLCRELLMVNLVAADGASLAVVESFPREIRELTHFWIPLSDGTRLAARMWLPTDAETNPVPAIVEAIPYRQADFTAPRDRLMHPYFAGHGYAAIRLDIRGSGNSDGLPLDEYVKQEQDDALEVLEWLANQPWCSGRTGLIGISWGGFAALQIAARKPASLGAIITVCSTDDRYNDDVHYLGGCLLSNNLSWGGVMYGYSMRPPDPEIVGPTWREQWRERMAQAPVAIADWMAHQTRDDYWKHGSVCEDYAAIECAVYAVGGWTDGYTNSIGRLLANLDGPSRGLIGPWAHGYPHIAAPGPAIGFLDDALRWWDRWLKDADNGIDTEPKLIAWQQEPWPPSAEMKELPGRWISETRWPPRTVSTRALGLHGQKLTETISDQAETLPLSSPVDVGVYAGEWTPHGIGPEMAVDQRRDDAGSLVFDSEPLTEDLAILGAPLLLVRLTSSTDKAILAARLNAVAPDGSVSRVTYGLLNLTHRNGQEEPQLLEPGVCFSLRLRMSDVAMKFPAGYRLRLSLSTSHWPLAWPSPVHARLGVHTDGASLELPVRHSSAIEPSAQFGPPAVPKSPPVSWLRGVRRERRINRNLSNGETKLTWVKDDGAYRLEDSAMEVDARGEETHTIVDGEPLSASSISTWRFEHRRGDWRVRVMASNTLEASADDFVLTTTVEAREGEDIVFSDVSERIIPRGFL